MIYRKIFSLDISDFSIKVLQLNAKKKALTFGRVVLEKGTVQDGLILNKKKLAGKITELLLNAGIKTGKVILPLPDSKVFIHIFHVPQNLKGKDLRSAVQSEAEKTIPIEISKMYWDYQVISPKIEKNQQAILFAGTLKEVVDGYLEVLKGAGLEPFIFEIESLALGRALLKGRKIETGVLVVDIGARSTNISIFDKDIILKDSIVVPVGGNKIDEAIARDLKIDIKEAEKLKADYGLSKKIQKGKLARIIERELDPVIDKSKKSIRYYGENIQEVFLTGGSAQLPGLKDYFTLKLDLDITIGISPLADQLKGKSILYNTVVGSALRALEKSPERASINLLPDKTNKIYILPNKKSSMDKILPRLKVLFAILAFCFLGWVVYFYILKPPSVEKQTEPASVKEETTIESVEEGGGVSVIEDEEEGGVAVVEEEPEEEPEESGPEVTISQTETGWLNVRSGAGTGFPVVAKIYPGESYPLLDEISNWYKIELVDDQKGWISARYATKNE